MGIESIRRTIIGGGSSKRGFISASLLTLFFFTMLVSLSIGKAMQITVERTNHTMDAIRGGLAFERILLESDLGMPVQPFQSGSFRVDIEDTPVAEGGRRVRIYLTDRTQLKEEVWLNIAASY